MKKLLWIFILSTAIFSPGYCNNNGDITVYNLKENNTYILNIDYNADKIEISDNNIIDIIPITTLTDSHQLFIETNGSGICDVLINSNNKKYQYRFITGKLFQENKDELIELDIPPVASI